MNTGTYPTGDATHACFGVSLDYDHNKRACYLHVINRKDGHAPIYFLVDYFGHSIDNPTLIALAIKEVYC